MPLIMTWPAQIGCVRKAGLSLQQEQQETTAPPARRDLPDPLGLAMQALTCLNACWDKDTVQVVFSPTHGQIKSSRNCKHTYHTSLFQRGSSRTCFCLPASARVHGSVWRLRHEASYQIKSISRPCLYRFLVVFEKPNLANRSSFTNTHTHTCEIDTVPSHRGIVSGSTLPAPDGPMTAVTRPC
jgi:hypothetical protein